MATIEPVEIELLVRNAELPDPELVLARFAEHYAESVERARDLAARADMGEDALFQEAAEDEELLDITALASEGEGGDDVGGFFAAQAGDEDVLAAESAGEELELPDLDAQPDLGDAATELDAMLAAAEEMPALGELGELGETAEHEGAALQGALDGAEEAAPGLAPVLSDEAWDGSPDAEPAANASPAGDERVGEELAPEDEWSADQWAVEPEEEAPSEAEAQAPLGEPDEGTEWSGDQWAAEPNPDDGGDDGQEAGVGFDAPEAVETTPPVAGADEDDDDGAGFGAQGPLDGDEAQGVGFDAPEAAESTPPIMGADEDDDDDTGFGAQGPLDGDEAQGVGFDAPEAAESTPPITGADEDDDDVGFGAQGPLEQNEGAQEDGQAGEWSADLRDAAPEDEER